MKAAGIVAVLFAVAGCAGGNPLMKDGLAEVQMRNSSGDVAAPARRYMSVPTRSFQAGPEGEWLEVLGAQCSVTSGLYRATLTTPARLVLPDLGPDAEPITAVCSTGILNGREMVAPEYPWPAEGSPSGVSKMTYGGGWWYGYEKSGPMKYPDIAVALN